MSKKHLLIVSKPRSGSTILTRILDTYDGVLSLPESFFPHVLDFISEDEFRNKKYVASLFLASCPDGCPLSLAESESCISDNPLSTLENIAEKISSKYKRDFDVIKVVVWKSTRMVGSWKTWDIIGGFFLILTRNRLNVYQSQFRVHFGQKNRNPLRYALFDMSYERAFAKYPSIKTFRMAYSKIDAEVMDLLIWLNVSGKTRSGEHPGGISELSGNCYWHSEIKEPFINKDSQKLRELSYAKILLVRIGVLFWSCFPIILRHARQVADHRQMKSLVKTAMNLK